MKRAIKLQDSYPFPFMSDLAFHRGGDGSAPYAVFETTGSSGTNGIENETAA
jgi:hypothetical protein